MLFITLLLSLLAITSYAAPASRSRSMNGKGKAAAAVKKATVVHPKVRWNTEFPEVLLGGSEIDLDWEGGSGKYVSAMLLSCGR